MIIECVDNGGFEDQMEIGQIFHVKERGQNSYLIENHKGQLRWYGTAKFSIEFMV